MGYFAPYVDETGIHVPRKVFYSGILRDKIGLFKFKDIM